jgi:hypothetical protein
MAIDVSDMPNYGPTTAAYQRARAEAASKGDDQAVLKLDLENARFISDLKDEKVAQERRTREVEAARTAAQAKYPGVKPELYAHLQDPAEIDRVAGGIQAAIDERAAAQPGAGSWGGQPPQATATTPPPPKTAEEEMDELRPLVNQGIKQREANKRFRSLVVGDILDVVVARRSLKDDWNYQAGRPLTSEERSYLQGALPR